MIEREGWLQLERHLMAAAVQSVVSGTPRLLFGEQREGSAMLCMSANSESDACRGDGIILSVAALAAVAAGPGLTTCSSMPLSACFSASFSLRT